MEITPKKIYWTTFGLSAIGIGLYPLAFLSSGFRKSGFFSVKSRELLANPFYISAFYTHISLGGIALLTGWSQFIKSWRNKYRKLHRFLGYIYVTSVLGSSITGLIVAVYSTGRKPAAIGFGALAVSWFISNLKAFFQIRKGKVKEHERWMIRNFALTFSAVTLRVYLPILLAKKTGIVKSLQIASWLCWVPNAIIAEIYIQSQYDGKESKSIIKSKKKQQMGSAKESISSEAQILERKSQ